MKVSAFLAGGLAMGGASHSALADTAAVVVPCAFAREQELVRQACLAASSHNTQPWRFHVAPGKIVVKPDYARRCPQVDPFDHHLWVSIGCAVENIVQAAPGLGLRAQAWSADSEVQIELREAPGNSPAPLAAAIALRQSTRSEYDGRPVSADYSRLLEAVARQGEGVDAGLITDAVQRKQIEALILTANAAQLESAGFRGELKKWLRFNNQDARASGDGLYAACSGNPVLPRWLGRTMFDWLYTAASANKTLERQLQSSAGLILLHSERKDWRQWVEVGRSVQRLALQITLLGLKMAFVNQPLEHAESSPRLMEILGLTKRHPDILIRYGYAESMPRSFRRPLASVLI